MKNNGLIFLNIVIIATSYMQAMRKGEEQLIASLRRKLPAGMTVDAVDQLEKRMRKDAKDRSDDPDHIKAKFKQYIVCLEPSMPIKPALCYYKQLCDIIKCGEGNTYHFIKVRAEENDSKAFILQRYFKTIISKAFSLRSPQLKEDAVADELKLAVAEVHKNLRDLTHIATGKDNPLLTQEQWNTQWKEVEAALYGPIVNVVI